MKAFLKPIGLLLIISMILVFANCKAKKQNTDNYKNDNNEMPRPGTDNSHKTDSLKRVLDLKRMEKMK
ncbi:MAG: hypothetical protein ACK4K9_05875 [Bacteroidia bacterium]